MEELLLIILRVCFAILWGLLESAVYIPFDFGYDRAIKGMPTFFILLIYFALGCAMGGLSLLLLPSTWIAIPSLRILTLIVSPCFGGLLGVLTAKLVDHDALAARSWRHFWPGFVFALGLSAIRFTYCKR